MSDDLREWDELDVYERLARMPSAQAIWKCLSWCDDADTETLDEVVNEVWSMFSELRDDEPEWDEMVEVAQEYVGICGGACDGVQALADGGATEDDQGDGGE